MRVALVPLRQLPLGDDSTDVLDQASIDAMDSSGPELSFAPVPSIPAPDISSDFNFGPAVGPAAPGEIAPVSQMAPDYTDSTDLSQLILQGSIPPPTGSNLTPQQVSQLAASGANASDINSIISGKNSPSSVLASLSALAATTGNVVRQLPSTGTGLRPSPVTSPYGVPGGGSTSILNPLTMLEESSIIPGVPNWVLLAGAIVGVAAISGARR